MKLACNRLIDSVWVLGYEQIDDDYVEIVFYDRDVPVGELYERQVPSCRVIKNENRIVKAVQISDQAYHVSNPRQWQQYPFFRMSMNNMQRFLFTLWHLAKGGQGE